MTKEEMIKKFQCPGCVGGPDPKTCESFKLNEEYGFKCGGHVMGTTINLMTHIALGLPKGYNRSGPRDDMTRTRNTLSLALWEKKGSLPAWDKLNVPVWASEQEGFLFVRSYSPRTDRTRIDVVEGGTMALVPGALDTNKFVDEFD